MSRSNANFSSRYSVMKKLGEGGYGTVWLVREISDGTLHVAKIVPDEKCRRKTWCEARQFWIPDEIIILEILDHPNIVKLEDIYIEEDHWVLIMEFSPNYRDLFDYIAETGPMLVEDARVLISQLFDAVNYLTSRGIDHRDIKDENVLYNPKTKQMKLLDFGSSSLINAGSYTTFQGTPVYLPPQFHWFGSYSALPAASWAVGCLSYSILNGEPVFTTTQQVAEFKILNFKNPNLDQMSKEFLNSLLNADEEVRMLPEEAAHHPWIQCISKK